MKIFLGYGHDSTAPLIERMKEYLSKDARAFPQVMPQQAAKLSIYPMSIEPRAELPNDMRENYHFGEI